MDWRGVWNGAKFWLKVIAEGVAMFVLFWAFVVLMSCM